MTAIAYSGEDQPRLGYLGLIGEEGKESSGHHLRNSCGLLSVNLMHLLHRLTAVELQSNSTPFTK